MAEELVLSRRDVDGLAQALRSPAATEAAKAARAETEVDFCRSWPDARKALVFLRGVLNVVPGVGPFARAAIGVVIVAGDAAEKAFCKTG